MFYFRLQLFFTDTPFFYINFKINKMLEVHIHQIKDSKKSFTFIFFYSTVIFVLFIICFPVMSSFILSPNVFFSLGSKFPN